MAKKKFDSNEALAGLFGAEPVRNAETLSIDKSIIKEVQEPKKEVSIKPTQLVEKKEKIIAEKIQPENEKKKLYSFYLSPSLKEDMEKIAWMNKKKLATYFRELCEKNVEENGSLLKKYDKLS